MRLPSNTSSESESFIQKLPPQIDWDPGKPHNFISGDVDGEKIQSIAGILSIPINDETRVEIQPTGKPTGIVEVFSSSALEEDIAKMEITGRYVIPEKEREEIIRTAMIKVLQEVGRYVPRKKLDFLFPGLDLNSIESYDTNNSRIRVFILPDEDYVRLYTLQNSGYYSGSEGFTHPGVTPYVYPMANTITTVDMSEKRTIVLPEGNPNNSYIGPIPAKQEVVLKLKEELESKTIHEILHTLDVGEGLPPPMKEAIVEWYAKGILFGDVNDDNYYHESKARLAYKNETEAVSLLITSMLESNTTDMDTIYKAFVSNENAARTEIAVALVRLYGLEETERILTWRYRNSRQALRHIVSLVAKQDLPVGEFVRTFLNKDFLRK